MLRPVRKKIEANNLKRTEKSKKKHKNMKYSWNGQKSTKIEKKPTKNQRKGIKIEAYTYRVKSGNFYVISYSDLISLFQIR